MEASGFTLFLDASGTWCAAPPGFRNLVLDPTGWGATAEEAVSALLAQPEFASRARAAGWPTPTLADFQIVPELGGAKIDTIAYASGKPILTVIPGGRK